MGALRRLAWLCAVPVVVFACGGETSADDGADESDVVGVEDLAALESELGLVKDAKGAHGFARNIKKGPCFKKGQAQTPKWQFRRYKTGAAFFNPQSNQPGQGASRPLVCLDLDTHEVGPGMAVEFDRFEIDALVRYKVGKFEEFEGALGGERALTFANGLIDGHSRTFLCGAVDLEPGGVSASEPWIAAGVAANKACREGGETVEACQTKAVHACEDAAKKSSGRLDERLIAGDTGTPDIDVERIMIGTHVEKSVDSVVASVVARYALKKAKSANEFNMDEDPVGRFLDVENGGGFTHVRYGRLDVHQFEGPNKEMVVITPKSSDEKIEASAIVKCERPAKADLFDCEKPGQPLAP